MAVLDNEEAVLYFLRLEQLTIKRSDKAGVELRRIISDKVS